MTVRGGCRKQKPVADRRRSHAPSRVANPRWQFRRAAASLTVVTRNMADFEPTGVPVLNPWR